MGWCSVVWCGVGVGVGVVCGMLCYGYINFLFIISSSQMMMKKNWMVNMKIPQ